MKDDIENTAELELTELLGLSNLFFIGVKRIHPGDVVSILRCYQLWGHVNVQLGCPGESEGFWYSAKTFFTHDDSVFLCLTYPPEMTADSEVPPEFLLEVQDKRQVTPVSNDRLIQLVSKYLAVVRSDSPIDLELMSHTIGPIPEWEEEEEEED